MINGNITIGNVSDAGFMEVLKAQEATKTLLFAQNTGVQTTIAGAPPNQKQYFNGLQLIWTNADGLRALAKLLDTLAGMP